MRVRGRLQGGFRNQVEDPGVAVSLDMARDSSTLLLAFGGMHGDIGMPPFEFFTATGEIPVKRLFVRDLKRSWYQRGIEGHGETIEAAAAALRELIAAHDVERVVAVGCSAGGYGAMVFGTLLGVEKVLSFGPQTTVDLEILAELDDHRWDEPLRELHAAGAIDPDWSDLREALPRARWADTRYEIYYSSVNSRPKKKPGPGLDRRQAERLRGLEGTRLYRFGAGGHSIARLLRENGALDKILRRALLEPPGTEPRSAAGAGAGALREV